MPMPKFKEGDHIFNNENKLSAKVVGVYADLFYNMRFENPDAVKVMACDVVDKSYGLIKNLDEEPVEAQRFNMGKLVLTQCPVGIRASIAAAFQYNSAKFGGKYEDGNWRRGMSWTTVLNSTYRHLAEFECGIDADADDGMDPLWHAAANIAMLIEYRKTNPDGDDRFKGQALSYREIQDALNKAIEKRDE